MGLDQAVGNALNIEEKNYSKFDEVYPKESDLNGSADCISEKTIKRVISETSLESPISPIRVSK